MSVVDQINDVLNDPNLSRQEKREFIGRLRAKAVKAALEIDLPKVFVRGPYTIVLTKLDNVGKTILAWPYVTQKAQEIKIDYPIVIVNPPILVADPLGDIVIGTPPNEYRYRLDPTEAFHHTVRDVILAAT